MKDFIAKKFSLDIQLFAEGEGGGEGEGGKGAEETVSKAMYDKAAGEIARLKKELRGKMTAEEQAKRAQEEKDEEIKELKEFKLKSELVSGLSEAFGKDVSAKIADSYLSGDANKFAEALSKAFKDSTQALNDEISQLKLKGMDKPGAGSNGGEGGTITKEQFAKMNIDERIALKISNPELFAQFMKG